MCAAILFLVIDTQTSPIRGESSGTFSRCRGERREEMHFVGCWQSGDCEGGEEAVGEG
jgi:hypothetical protein